MSEEYKVHKTWIEKAEFEALVIEIPEAEVEDKLTYLSRDKGNITKSFYEDFIITTCVANINQLLYHVRQREASVEVISEIRDCIIEEILKHNVALKPDNLVINRNLVVKIKKDGEENVVPLTENKSWNIAPYLEPSAGEDAISADEIMDAIEERPVKSASIVKDIDELNFTVVKQWWKRINQYIEVKKFSEGDLESILNQRFFHNRSSFRTYIVSVCLVDSEDLFTMLDDMGLPNQVAAPILMNEVYELCRSANPFLTYEKAKNLLDEDDKDDGLNNKTNGRMASHAQQCRTRSKKKKKSFKDVPRKDLLQLGEAIKVAVIGQDEAVDNIVEAIQRASVGLKDPERPIGSFLFAGRTGIGKTLTSKVLADELIKDKDNLVTIDCSEYSADHEYAKLIGSPSGYVGHDQGGQLTNAIMENPFSIVVFDEFEKASHKVHELMLQILEEGRLTDGKGQKVSFKDCVVIMTSNIGVKEVEEVKNTIGFGDVAELTEDKKTKAIDNAIKKKFKPEFLNRIDSIVHFGSLSDDDYTKIVDLELYKLNDNLKTNDTDFKNLTLKFDKKVKEYILERGINKDFGARPLKRCIEKEISTPLANKLLKSDIDPEATVKITVVRNKVTFKITDPIKKTEEIEEVTKSLGIAE